MFICGFSLDCQHSPRPEEHEGAVGVGVHLVITPVRLNHHQVPGHEGGRAQQVFTLEAQAGVVPIARFHAGDGCLAHVDPQVSGDRLAGGGDGLVLIGGGRRRCAHHAAFTNGRHQPGGLGVGGAAVVVHAEDGLHLLPGQGAHIHVHAGDLPVVDLVPAAQVGTAAAVDAVVQAEGHVAAVVPVQTADVGHEVIASA